jgi:hypothetical protein
MSTRRRHFYIRRGFQADSGVTELLRSTSLQIATAKARHALGLLHIPHRSRAASGGDVHLNRGPTLPAGHAAPLPHPRESWPHGRCLLEPGRMRLGNNQHGQTRSAITRRTCARLTSSPFSSLCNMPTETRQCLAARSIGSPSSAGWREYGRRVGEWCESSRAKEVFDQGGGAAWREDGGKSQLGGGSSFTFMIVKLYWV